MMMGSNFTYFLFIIFYGIFFGGKCENTFDKDKAGFHVITLFNGGKESTEAWNQLLYSVCRLNYSNIEIVRDWCPNEDCKDDWRLEKHLEGLPEADWVVVINPGQEHVYLMTGPENAKQILISSGKSLIYALPPPLEEAEEQKKAGTNLLNRRDEKENLVTKETNKGENIEEKETKENELDAEETKEEKETEKRAMDDGKKLESEETFAGKELEGDPSQEKRKSQDKHEENWTGRTTQEKEENENDNEINGNINGNKERNIEGTVDNLPEYEEKGLSPEETDPPLQLVLRGGTIIGRVSAVLEFLRKGKLPDDVLEDKTAQFVLFGERLKGK
ncbi:hypothetical protein SK128_004516 [Halocaridina rubra]|uniref:Uncharacterized protein n=1 Tax=Halocaridina rubra TaxID=373956 RepID=A0AAN8WVS9_HALRR